MQEVSGCKPAPLGAVFPCQSGSAGGGCAGGCFSERYDSVFSFLNWWAEQETNALPNAGTDTCSCVRARSPKGFG